MVPSQRRNRPTFPPRTNRVARSVKLNYLHHDQGPLSQSSGRRRPMDGQHHPVRRTQLAPRLPNHTTIELSYLIRQTCTRWERPQVETEATFLRALSNLPATRLADPLAERLHRTPPSRYTSLTHGLHAGVLQLLRLRPPRRKAIRSANVLSHTHIR